MRPARRPENPRAIPFLLVVAMLCPFAHGKVIYVDDDATGANDGTSWENAYVYVQDALADANESDRPVEIRVAQGIYKPDRGVNQMWVDPLCVGFQLINGVTLKGSYAGTRLPDPNDRDIKKYETILSGDLLGNDRPVIRARDMAGDPTRLENCQAVLSGRGTDETAIVDGFTVTSGNLDVWCYSPCGGAGLVCEWFDSPTVRNCTFVDNSAGGNFGGAIYGGAPTLMNCVFRRNLAGFGGALSYCRGSIDKCVFIGNSAWYGGALCWPCCGASAIANSLFIANEASTGGAIYCMCDSNLKVSNCTFAQNDAEKGAAITWARPYGQECSGSASLNSCILRDGGNEIYIEDASTVELTHSSIEGGWPGEGNIDVDPLFASPCHWDPNGTPDDPNDDIFVEGDYHLKSQAGRWDEASESWVRDDVTSPCIDAGDPNSPVAFEPSPNGGLINMGAYGGTAEASKSPSGLHAPYGGGTGEPNDPYLIYTAEHLNAMGAEPNDWDKHFQLMADIDLSGYPYHQAAIAPDTNDVESGFQGTSFTGVFDGNRHTISHLTVSGVEALGLFGYIGEGGKVKSLGIEDVNIAGGDLSEELGGLAGYNEGEITDCYATGSVTGGADAANLGGLVGYNLGGTVADCFAACSVAGGAALQDEPKHIGGLVGWNDWGVVANCHATGDVTAGNASAGLGGLVGCNEQGTITDCHATGIVTGGDNSESLGGLVGENGDEVDIGVITDCHASGGVIGGNAAESLGGLVGSNYATISGCYATGAVTGRDSCSQLGGLAGENWSGGNVTCCFAVGDVTGGNSSERIGGFAGTNGGEGRIRESYAAGSVRAGSDSHCLGGLVGENEGGEEAGYVWNCYSTANVTADGGSEEIGGLVGKNDGGDDSGRVRDCYSTGAVMAGASSDVIGGLVGDNLGSIRDSFWDTETSGLNAMCGRQDTHAHDCDDANGKTTAEMQDPNTFIQAGWDFVDETENGTDDTWWIDEGQDYPRLWWELGDETP